METRKENEFVFTLLIQRTCREERLRTSLLIDIHQTAVLLVICSTRTPHRHGQSAAKRVRWNRFSLLNPRHAREHVEIVLDRLLRRQARSASYLLPPIRARRRSPRSPPWTHGTARNDGCRASRKRKRHASSGNKCTDGWPTMMPRFAESLTEQSRKRNVCRLIFRATSFQESVWWRTTLASPARFVVLSCSFPMTLFCCAGAELAWT